ncbi:tetratricopeptide repeat protein [Dictyocaulus viviparus]|uniref:Tetratricopeptide repeat protein n=1 Tax=Dictyocaulus viviparus TaxID=29172 RepID=A0A0D8Y808_DICVI|nr:tetratricopeptide repeat protein [Dictyocaulus viviparus]
MYRTSTKSSSIGDEERAKIIKKLDDDLEQFMEEMSAKRAAQNHERKAFDFDEWCKDIEQHPAFMTDIETGLKGEYADAISALQALKYDDDIDEDKHACAERYKQDGNGHFKMKKYRWATDCYSEGIKQKCLDRRLNSILYSNRAAAQYHIGNFRSAIKDCAMALRFNPSNVKAAVRGADCLLQLGHAKECIEWVELAEKNFASECNIYERGKPAEDEQNRIDSLRDIKKKAADLLVIVERDQRKARLLEKKELDAKRRLLEALKERGLNLRPRLPFARPDLMDWSLLEVNIPQAPEVGQVDLLTDCDETSELGSVLRPLLASPSEWDIHHVFRIENVRMFVSDEWDEFVMEIWEWSTFGSILSLEGYKIVQGLPVVMVFTRHEVDEKFTFVKDNKFVVR